jgi:hypothetical protein
MSYTMPLYFSNEKTEVGKRKRIHTLYAFAWTKRLLADTQGASAAQVSAALFVRHTENKGEEEEYHMCSRQESPNASNSKNNKQLCVRRKAISRGCKLGREKKPVPMQTGRTQQNPSAPDHGVFRRTRYLRERKRFLTTSRLPACA